MCGRYATSRTANDLNRAFEADLGGLDASGGLPEADYNVAPTKEAPLVIGRRAGDSAQVSRELLAATWGLVPSWAKDRSIGSRLINARWETVSDKPSFRRAFERRRSLVPADGFYEWYQGQPRAGEKKAPKQPFYLSPGEGDGLALAGLHEFWRESADAPWLITFTILTTSAEDVDGRLHDRAPLLLEPTDFDAWLDPAPHPADELLGLLIPATPGRLAAWPVSTAVNNVRNNGPDLVRPLPPE